MKTNSIDSALASADPSHPTFAQFQHFAQRNGVGVIIGNAERRLIAGRSAFVTEVSIRRSPGDGRITAPIVQGLVGPAGRTLAKVLEPALAWLRFCDLASLPRPPNDQENWDEISTRAVVEHVSYMLGVPPPDIGALEADLALWRRSTLAQFARGLSPPTDSRLEPENRKRSARSHKRPV
jgi:hypothetical protein